MRDERLQLSLPQRTAQTKIEPPVTLARFSHRNPIALLKSENQPANELVVCCTPSSQLHSELNTNKTNPSIASIVLEITLKRTYEWREVTGELALPPNESQETGWTKPVTLQRKEDKR